MNTTIRFHSYGGPEVLEAENQPDVGAPSEGQVRLRHLAIGVNFIDTMFRSGIVPVPLPAVPGVEGVGIVEAIGSGVGGLAVGQRVAYYLAPGSYTQERLIDASALVPVPDDIGAGQIAAVLTKGLTAWAGLNGYHRLQTGETILVQGASSGVGSLLARWAKARGATVIGTAGSSEKRQALEGTIDHVLPSDAQDLAQRVREIAPGGVDVVYEFVGRSTFDATLASVKDGGVVVSIGAASGAPVFDKEAAAKRGLKMVGGPMAPFLAGQVSQAVDDVFDAFRAGVLGDVPFTEYALRDASEAHAAIAARTKTGALVLMP